MSPRRLLPISAFCTLTYLVERKTINPPYPPFFFSKGGKDEIPGRGPGWLQKTRFFVAPLLKNDSRRIWIPDKNIQEWQWGEIWLMNRSRLPQSLRSFAMTVNYPLTFNYFGFRYCSLRLYSIKRLWCRWSCSSLAWSSSPQWGEEIKMRRATGRNCRLFFKYFYRVLWKVQGTW